MLVSPVPELVHTSLTNRRVREDMRKLAAKFPGGYEAWLDQNQTPEENIDVEEG
ncbi:hypothetical protein SAMD00023353_0701050 [Rosellinia necatrix]|uniref:Uncharacterized protein n=1 Tax=Rosellinia necatrix TaxID=77044 RepID=A0A1S8A6E8_ROSNE|nr:hypothetical protein SAMD00023353_0701050 [Rosellinia necatrix]